MGLVSRSGVLTSCREELEDEEKKQKDEEEAAAKAKEGDAGAVAGEADPLDEWGSFAPVGGKKKKGKKGAEEPAPAPAPEPAVEATADDDWGFATKKKKGKKGKVRSAPSSAFVFLVLRIVRDAASNVRRLGVTQPRLCFGGAAGVVARPPLYFATLHHCILTLSPLNTLLLRASYTTTVLIMSLER